MGDIMLRSNICVHETQMREEKELEVEFQN